MKTKAILTALTLTIATAAAAAPEIDKARIDNMAAMMLKQAEQSPQMQGQPVNGEEIRKMATQRLQIMEVLKNEAIKAGLDKDAQVQLQLQNLQAEVYSEAYTDYLVKKTEVGDADARRFYDQNARTVQIQQIAFDTDAEARAAQELLLKGLSFEELMKRHPEQSQGSNNEFASPRQLDPQLGQIISGMKRGDVTRQPVRIGNKFVLIKLAAESRDPQVPPFEQIKTQLIEQVKQQKVQEQITQILKNNGITLP